METDTATRRRARARRDDDHRRDPFDLRGARVGLYCRVSFDPNGNEKSVGDQEVDGRVWARKVGAQLARRHIYRDSDRSASRFATKQRESFDRLLADIAAGELDAVWFWELSRQQRRLDVFARLRDLCREHGVVWVIRDRVYDPTNTGDMVTLGMLSVMAENESEMTSQRVQRGKRASAHGGRPAGQVPFGYRRIWQPTPKGHDWVRDEPDPVEAPIVREMFERIAAGDSITLIRKDLNDRGVMTKRGYRWDNSTVRYVALSPTYLGQRVYRVEDHYDRKAGDRSKAVLQGVEPGWPALVDEETFWRVHRILTDPKRTTTRLGPRTGQYLLSALATCAECGSKLVQRPVPANNQRTEFKDAYVCRERACMSVTMADLDDYVSDAIVSRLADPATAARLSERDDVSEVAHQARADAEQARDELQRLFVDLAAGHVTPRVATIAEARLEAVIADAERREQEVTLPPVLLGLIGEKHARAGWNALDLPARRLVVRTIADVSVRRMGRGWRVPVEDRVVWRWKLGLDGDQLTRTPVRTCRWCEGPMPDAEWSGYCTPECQAEAKLARRRELHATKRAEAVSVELPTRECERCGEPFPVTRSDRRFCSEKCRAAATSRRQWDRERDARPRS